MGFRVYVSGLKGRSESSYSRLGRDEGLLSNSIPLWEFPKIRGTFFWGPYNKDPTI